MEAPARENLLPETCVQFPANGKPCCRFPFQLFNGGHKAVVRPDPFPNSAVKRCIADGSACIACARVGRRRFLIFLAESGYSVVYPSLSFNPLGMVDASLGMLRVV